MNDRALGYGYGRDRNDTAGEFRFTLLPSKADKYNGRHKTQDPGLKMQKILLSPGS